MRNRGWVEKRDPYRPPINYSKYLKSARKNILTIVIQVKDDFICTILLFLSKYG